MELQLVIEQTYGLLFYSQYKDCIEINTQKRKAYALKLVSDFNGENKLESKVCL